MSALKSFYDFDKKEINGKKVEEIFHPKLDYCYTDTKSPSFAPEKGKQYCDFREMEFEHGVDKEKEFTDNVCKSFQFSKGSKPIKDLSVFKALESMGMISDEDFNFLKECFNIRNELVHQLYDFLCNKKDFTFDLKANIRKLINISAKASENWIKAIDKDEAANLDDKDILDRDYFKENDVLCYCIIKYVFE